MEKHNFDILAEPWAITKQALESIFRQLNAGNHIQSELVSVPGETSGKIKLDVVSNIAIVPVQYSLFRFSYNTIRNRVEAAVNDDAV